jgi:hypothetical protein
MLAYASSEALQFLMCRRICHVRYSADSSELLDASGFGQSDELRKVLRNSDKTAQPYLVKTADLSGHWMAGFSEQTPRDETPLPLFPSSIRYQLCSPKYSG